MCTVDNEIKLPCSQVKSATIGKVPVPVDKGLKCIVAVVGPGRILNQTDLRRVPQ